MALISATFDTVNKTLAVSVDGKSVDSVFEAYFSKDYYDGEKFTCSVTTATEDKDQKTRLMTRLVAGDKGLVAAGGNIPAGEFVPACVSNDIAKYFSKE